MCWVKRWCLLFNWYHRNLVTLQNVKNDIIWRWKLRWWQQGILEAGVVFCRGDIDSGSLPAGEVLWKFCHGWIRMNRAPVIKTCCRIQCYKAFQSVLISCLIFIRIRFFHYFMFSIFLQSCPVLLHTKFLAKGIVLPSSYWPTVWNSTLPYS